MFKKMCKIYFAKLCNLLLYIMDFNFCWNKMSTKDLHLWGGDFYEDGLNQLLEQVFIHSYNTTKLNLYFLKILFTRILWHFSPPFLPTIWSLHFKSFSNFRVFFLFKLVNLWKNISTFSFWGHVCWLKNIGLNPFNYFDVYWITMDTQTTDSKV